jgi:hypothetical protein
MRIALTFFQEWRETDELIYSWEQSALTGSQEHVLYRFFEFSTGGRDPHLNFIENTQKATRFYTRGSTRGGLSINSRREAS